MLVAMRLLLSFCLCFFLHTGFAQYKEPSVLMQADRAFARLSYEKGIEAAFTKYADDSVVFMSHGGFPVFGRQNLVRIFADDSTTLIWQPMGGFVDSDEETGFTYGISRSVTRRNGTFAEEHYNYISNWRKTNAGEWKIISDAGTPLNFRKFNFVDTALFKAAVAPAVRSLQTKKEKNLLITRGQFLNEGDRKVPFLWIAPNKTPAKAVVFFQHGAGEGVGKDNILQEAVELAKEGIATLALDAPFARKGIDYMPLATMADSAVLHQTLADWKAAVHLLPSLKAGNGPIIFWGHSWGASIAAAMPFVSLHIKHIILSSGVANASQQMQYSLDPQLVAVRKAIGNTGMRAYVKSIGPYDALDKLSMDARVSVLMQAPLHEQYPSMFDYLSSFVSIKGPKELRWYETGHNLNEAAKIDRLNRIKAWIGE